MKQGRYCALVLGCALLLTGCESWRRLPSPDAPKEVTAASIWQQEEEQPDGQQEQDAGGLAVEQSTATDMLSASITARGEEEPAWSSSDEMLSNKLYSLLTHKNEKFMENFDDREYDYLAQLTDAQGEEYQFYLWVNFERENEVIVEDEQGSQWDLSVEDSNQLRAMIVGLG